MRLPENSAFYTCALSPDARFIGLVSYDVYPYELRLYELTEPVATLVWRTPLEDDLLQLAYSPDGSQLFGVESIGKLRAWYTADGSLDPSMPDIYAYPFALSPDGQLLAGQMGANLAVMRLSDWTVLYTLPGEGGFALMRAPAGESSIGGYVQIPGWIGVAPEHLRYTLRRYETGEVVDEGTLSLDPRGLTSSMLFGIPAPAGRYWLTVSGKPFLTRTVDTSGGALRITLLAGDIDGDNEVTLFDFGKLVAAFGSMAGEDRYDIDADLDGDGEITLSDFAWLVRNFGLAGDE